MPRPPEPHTDPDRLQALIEAGIRISAERGLDQVLQQVVDAARAVIGSRYAALGILDITGTELSRFVVSGLNLEQRAQIGQLPTGRGVLGLLIADPHPLRIANIGDHAKSVGFPKNHPHMNSFLGVPIPGRRGPIGNLYLTEKVGGGPFTDEDESIAVLFGAQVGVAVENAALNDETQRLLAEVQAMQRSRDRFFATINHELRNALTAIYGWSELLLRKLGDEPPRAALEVHESADWTLALLNDLLDLSRIEADRLRPVMRDADLCELVHEAVRSLEPTATDRRVTLVFNTPQDGVDVRTDPQRVRQILMNLLSNAIRHSPEADTVRITLTLATDVVTISVADRGDGIPAEIQEHIFEAFARGQTDGGGTGLGLTLSRQLARLMGGNLGVRSREGAGATFTLSLPRREGVLDAP